MIYETPISTGHYKLGLSCEIEKVNTFDIPFPQLPPGRRIMAAWYVVVDNFKHILMWQSIRVEPAVGANGASIVRLMVNPNEEPAHMTIQIFAEYE